MRLICQPIIPILCFVSLLRVGWWHSACHRLIVIVICPSQRPIECSEDQQLSKQNGVVNKTEVSVLNPLSNNALMTRPICRFHAIVYTLVMPSTWCTSIIFKVSHGCAGADSFNGQGQNIQMRQPIFPTLSPLPHPCLRVNLDRLKARVEYWWKPNIHHITLCRKQPFWDAYLHICMYIYSLYTILPKNCWVDISWEGNWWEVISNFPHTVCRMFSKDNDRQIFNSCALVLET